jgi:hypothetical protein
VTNESEKQQEESEENSSNTMNRERRLSPDNLLIPPSTTTSVAVETISVAPSSPKNILKNSKRKDIFLSGISSMKEVFDVSYAVHRMGEERAQRKEKKKLQQNTNNTAQHRFKVFNASIENDDDENEEDIMINDDDDVSSNESSTSSSESLSSTENNNHERHIESLCKTLDFSTINTGEKGKSRNSNLLIKKLAGGLHPDGPPIVNQRVKKTFDLNLNDATLLGRRKNVPL